jgi:prevent-host-death family protein
MAREVQASEAETHLHQLLDEVEQGETIVITRDGRAVARIVPEAHLRQQEIDEAIEDIKELGKTTGRISIEEILSWRHAGHKYLCPLATLDEALASAAHAEMVLLLSGARGPRGGG